MAAIEIDNPKRLHTFISLGNNVDRTFFLFELVAAATIASSKPRLRSAHQHRTGIFAKLHRERIDLVKVDVVGRRHATRGLLSVTVACQRMSGVRPVKPGKSPSGYT